MQAGEPARWQPTPTRRRPRPPGPPALHALQLRLAQPAGLAVHALQVAHGGPQQGRAWSLLASCLLTAARLLGAVAARAGARLGVVKESVGLALHAGRCRSPNRLAAGGAASGARVARSRARMHPPAHRQQISTCVAVRHHYMLQGRMLDGWPAAAAPATAEPAARSEPPCTVGRRDGGLLLLHAHRPPACPAYAIRVFMCVRGAIAWGMRLRTPAAVVNRPRCRRRCRRCRAA